MIDGFVPSPSLDADGDLPGFKELLSTQNFVERLEAARLKRAQVLAKEAQNTDEQPVFLKSTRPWEKADLPTPKTLSPAAEPQLVSETEPAVALLVLASTMRRAPPKNVLVLANADPIVAVARPRKRRIMVARVAGGFVLGASMGLGLVAFGGWIAESNPISTRQTEPEVAQAAPVAPNHAALSVAAPKPRPVAPVVEPIAPALVKVEPSLPAQPSLRLADMNPAAPTIRHQPDAVLSISMPAKVVSSGVDSPTALVMSLPKPAPLIGGNDQALGQDARGLQSDGAIPAPGVISKVVLVSAPAGLVGRLQGHDTSLSVTDAPVAPPNGEFSGPAATVSAETHMPIASGFGRTPPTDVEIATTVPQVSLVKLEFDPTLSGASVEPPAPFADTSEISGDNGSLIDFTAYNVLLNAPGSMKDAEVTTLVASLTDTGFAVGEPVRVSFRISSNQVRYFHPKDAEAAQILAEEIGGLARDFTAFRPSPPVGNIEVWLAGTGAAKATASRPATKKRTQQPQSEAAKIQALRDRLILQLRTGQHL
ncbi:MAG: hypothetical protein WBO29_00360 [Albidovulum sp.]